MSFGTYTPRMYKQGGVKVPSATTVLSMLDKPALIPWAVNCTADYVTQCITGQGLLTEEEIRDFLKKAKKNYRTVSQKAAGIGTKVHDCIEAWLKKGEEPSLALPEEEQAWQAWLEWYNEQDLTPVDLEVEIHGDGYGGRLDLVCMLNGSKTLVDFKTSKGFYAEYPLQLAAYRKAYNRNLEDADKVTAHGVLKLDKLTGVPEYRDFSDTYEQDYEAFSHLVKFWWLTNGRQG